MLYGNNKLVPQHKKTYCLLFLILIILAFFSILNCTPPITRDALTHHLAVPKLYLLNGAIHEIPELIFSYYPMNLDLLYLIPLWLGNDSIPKFIHMSFGLATAWLIFHYLQKRLNHILGLTGALLFLTTPIIIHLSTSAYVDLGITFFSTASLLLIIHWRNTQKTTTIFLAGLCAGLAAGTKYNGLITLFLLTCFIPFLSQHANETPSTGSKIKSTLIFFCSALLAFSPWLIRNFVWTGNPIYPLFQSLFNAEQGPLIQGMNPLLIRKLIYNETLLQTLLVPIRIFFEGQDNNPQFFDGVLNPFLLLFSLAALIPAITHSQLKTDKRIFFWFTFLFLLFAFMQRVMRIRYIVPVLPSLTILCVFGITNLKNYLSAKRGQGTSILLLTLLLGATFFINGTYMLHHWQKIRPLQYLSGQVDRTAFIIRFWPEYQLIHYANNTLPKSANILAVFLGNRGYYFDRKVRFDLNSSKSLLCSQIQKQKAIKDVANYLNEIGISHILIRQDLFKFWYKQQLTEKDQEKLLLFFREYTQEIAAIRNYTLLALSPP